MRKFLGLAAGAVLAMSFSVGTVYASHEECYPALTAKGKKKHSMRSAMESAIAAWHHAAEKKHGDAFDDWYYSGDRAISCKWDKEGHDFTCTATARPCGRD